MLAGAVDAPRARTRPWCLPLCPHFLLRLFLCRAPGAGSAGQRPVCVVPPRSPDIAVWRGRAFMSLVVSDATSIIHSCAELAPAEISEIQTRDQKGPGHKGVLKYSKVTRSRAVSLELSHVVLEPCVGRLVPLHSLQARGSQNGVWPWGCGVRSLWRSLQFGYPPLLCALALSARERADRSICCKVLQIHFHSHLRRTFLGATCPNAQVPSGQGYLSSLPAGLKRLSDLLPTGESCEHGTPGSQALIRAGLCGCSRVVSTCLWPCQSCNCSLQACSKGGLRRVAGTGDRDEVVTVAFDVDTGPAKHLHFLNVCFRNGFQVLLRLLSRALLADACTFSSSSSCCKL